MQISRLGAMDLPTALAVLFGAAFCYAAWLTSIMFCAANGARPLLIAAATFFPVGIAHGIGVWFGGLVTLAKPAELEMADDVTNTLLQSCPR